MFILIIIPIVDMVAVVRTLPGVGCFLVVIPVVVPVIVPVVVIECFHIEVENLAIRGFDFVFILLCAAVKFDFVYADSVFPVELRFRKGYRLSR